MRLLTGSMERLAGVQAQDCTLVLGTFDGMHIGHAALCELARNLGGHTVLHTFLQHPRAVITGEELSLLATLDERISRVAEEGMQELRMLRFTQDTMRMEPALFLRYLAVSLQPRHIVVGFNHRFGHQGRGDAAFLRQNASKYGYRLHVVPPFRMYGEVVSSTAIRAYILAGNMEKAGDMLGYPYSLAGSIEHGQEFGRAIGYPTANVHPPDKLMPPHGVYTAYVELKSGLYEAVVNIGMRPTVGGQHLTIEAHLLDFRENIYGKFGRVHLLHLLRREQKFENTDALREAIALDARHTREYFAELDISRLHSLL